MPPENVNEQAQNAITKSNENSKITLSNLVKDKAVQLWGDERGQQFASALVTASDKNPKIKSCTPESILSAMMACISVNLIPETPAQFAYLIPYGNRIQFQIGYKGLIELAYRSGQVLSINAELVFGDSYEQLENGETKLIPGDQFEHKLGTERGIHHIPNMYRDRTDYKNVTHVYATAKLKNGTTVFEVMNISEIDRIRETVKAKSTDSPWTTWWDQMAKKTVIKRLCKYLPSSTEDNRLQQAIMYDSWAEAGKLVYENDELVEREQQIDVKQEPKKLKNFAVQNEVKNEESSEETTEEQLIEDIKKVFEFKKLTAQQKMSICNQYLNTPFLEKGRKGDLELLLEHLTGEVKESK